LTTYILTVKGQEYSQHTTPSVCIVYMYLMFQLTEKGVSY